MGPQRVERRSHRRSNGPPRAQRPCRHVRRLAIERLEERTLLSVTPPVAMYGVYSTPDDTTSSVAAERGEMKEYQEAVTGFGTPKALNTNAGSGVEFRANELAPAAAMTRLEILDGARGEMSFDAQFQARFAEGDRSLAGSGPGPGRSTSNAVSPGAGDLDPTFDFDGKLVTLFPGVSTVDKAYAVAIGADGKIVAAGQAAGDLALARYNPDGSLDTGFGFGGMVASDFGNSSERANAVVVQPDGKILVAGYVAGFSIVRYMPDGGLDGSFGTDGKVTVVLGDSSDEAFDIALQDDGKIVAVGRANMADPTWVDFGVVRLNTDGSLDGTFGTGGKVTTDFPGGGTFDMAKGLEIQPDGKIVVVGQAAADGHDDFAVARYNEDGTLDATFGLGSSRPEELTNVAGTLYFRAYDWAHGTELWKSDGTAEGTVLVKDINPGGAGSLPSDLTDVNGTLFFAADDGAGGTELWKTDGTAAGTVLVKDINPGAGASIPSNLINVNGTVFFAADDGANGAELWTSDGTEAGTVLVKDIRPGSSNASPEHLAYVNGMVLFSAYDGIHGAELWKSDGTAAGTVLVKDINPGGDNSVPRYFTDVDGTIFFRGADEAHGAEPWKTDGTEAGTVLIKDINPGGEWYSSPTSLTGLGGKLLFVAWDDINGDETKGRELWTSDGTAAGTVMVKDINPGSEPSYPAYLTKINGTVFFSAYDSTNSRELWKTDGTEAGTVLVADVNPDGSAGIWDLTDVSGTLFFQAYNAATGVELWTSDGTAAGTVLVRDINPGSGDSGLAYLTNVNGTLFFSASDGATGQELWASDGTQPGTVMVKDIVSGGGLVTVDINDAWLNNWAEDVAIQPDGKIVVGGSLGTVTGGVALARLHPDGTLDTSFDEDGTAGWYLDGGTGMVGHDIAIQGDGKIVLAGSVNTDGTKDSLLWRFNSDGSIEAAWRYFRGADEEEAWALAIQGDGKIVTAGYAESDGLSWFRLFRVNSDLSLDTTFDVDGSVYTGGFPIGGEEGSANAVGLQSDGKIVVAGSAGNSESVNKWDFALARYEADGSLDRSFGPGGVVRTDFASDVDVATDLVIQADGKIVAVGISKSGGRFDFALARYNVDGTLDAGFGSGGLLTTNLGSTLDRAWGAAGQADGKIVVAGTTGSTNRNLALARYDLDGSLDASFGSNGLVVTDIGPGWIDDCKDIVIGPDGKIVVTGYTWTGSRSDIVVARYDPNGTLDPTFGVGGLVVTNLGSTYDGAQEVALQVDGKIVVAGMTGGDLALVRYETDGSLDNAFGAGGIVTTDFGVGSDEGNAVTIQTDGKIVVAGVATKLSHLRPIPDFGLARYNPDGSLDAGFGVGGLVMTEFYPSPSVYFANDYAYAVVLQGDGKIVAAGSGVMGATGGFALARYLAVDPSLAVVGVSPPANSHDVSPAADVSVTYDLDMDPASATDQTFVVRAMQTGQLLDPPNTVSVSGPAVTLNPAANFHPGELVQATATTGLTSLDGGIPPEQPYVWQLRTEVTAGHGNFTDSLQDLGGSHSAAVSLGDLDGDGDVDAFVGNMSSENKVWLNDGGGTFTDSGQNLGSSDSVGVALGDLDGDGDLDAFVANYGHLNTVWLNDGSAVFTNTGQSLGGPYNTGVSLGDLDGDGDLDAFIANRESNKVWLNDGGGAFNDSGQSLGGYGSEGVRLGDLDSDGDLDAFVANNGGPNTVWLNDGGGTFTDSGQGLGSYNSPDVALGDLDGDGDLDAFVVNYLQPTRVWLNDGTGAFTNPGQGPGGSATYGLSIGDVDGDGDLDIFQASGQVIFPPSGREPNWVWLNDGAGVFTDSGLRLGNSDSRGAALADLDGDGDLDAFVANENSQPNNVWLNDQLGKIHGSKWEDLDGDGEWDPGEPGLPGWTIYIDANNNGQLDAAETRTTTDANGEYWFTDLPAGSYTVAEVQQPGWEQTFPTLPSVSFFGGGGDQKGTGLALDADGITISGITGANDYDGLVVQYPLPLADGASPGWSTIWPGLAGGDGFMGIAVSSDAVDVAGNSYQRTTDTNGGKESKGIVVSFPLDGPTGGGFGGANWDQQTPPSPGAFPYGGSEYLMGITTTVEDAATFIYATGAAQNRGNGGRLFLSKLDSAGNILWTRTDGAEMVGNAYSNGEAVVVLEGNIYAAGRSDDDGVAKPYLRKYDSSGNLLWSRKSPVPQGLGVYHGITSLGGFLYTVGSTFSAWGANDDDYLIQKYDEAGNLLWTSNFGQAVADVLTDVVGIGDQLFAVGHTTSEGSGGADMVVLQIDPATGEMLSKSLFGGAQDDFARGAATDGNDLYVAGESRSFAEGGNAVGENDVVLLHYTLGSWSVTLAGGQLVEDVDFGNQRAPAIVSHHIFYNNSSFDGNDPGANGQDDAAMAPDKVALLPGQTAAFENYTNYSRGINGIMVDVAGLAGTPTVDDFALKAGNSNEPAGWDDAPLPTSVTVRPGEGVDGSDRITLVWPDNAIQKQWLQVIIPAGGNLGLAEPDIFYFGNAIGESGTSPTDAKVNAIDMLAARNNPHNFFNPAPLDDFVDFDRDQKVNATDMLIARNNTTNFFTALKLIAVPPAAGDAVPVGKSLGSTVEGSELRVLHSDLLTLDSRLSTRTLDWLYEFERPGGAKPSRGGQAADAAAIDHLLATAGG